MNLLEETVEFLKKMGHSERTSIYKVIFVTDGQKSCSWKKFKEQADLEYDESFGSNEINLNLKVVGKDWWLERHEYDGSEWWEFKTMPKRKEFSEFIQIKES